MNVTPPVFVPLIQGDRRFGLKLAALFTGVAAIALSARVDVPMVPVPMSLQTLALLVVAALFGARWAFGTVVAYLAAATLGLPVLADGVSGQLGISRLLGPTAGYLLGFLIAAVMVGYLAERGWTCRAFIHSCGVMLLAHVIVLGCGVTRLSWLEGYDMTRALAVGANPFLLGAVVKSFAAAAIVLLLRRALGAHQVQELSGDRG